MMREIYLKLAKNQRLETKRLVLRPVTLDDVKAIYAISSDPEVVKYISYERHQSMKDTAMNIANYFMKQPLGKYGMELKETGELIGTIDINLRSNEVGEIGYQLARAYHRQGYMTEAAKKIINLSFEELNLRRVFATCLPENIASSGVLKKIGMKKEGTLHQQMRQEMDFYNLDLYCLWQKEYKSKNII